MKSHSHHQQYTLFSATVTVTVAAAVAVLNCTIIGIRCNPATSTTESEAIDKLRKNLGDELYQDYMKTDSYLINWLQKENFNLQSAARLIRECLKYRKENSLDSILTENFTKLEREFPFDLSSVDKDGRPVLIVPAGRWDVRKMIISGRSKDYERYSLWFYEQIAHRIRELNQKQPQNISNYFMVADMTGYNFRQHGCPACMQVSREIEAVAEKLYPRRIHRAVVINTPAGFERLHNAYKTLLADATYNSIQTFDSDQNKWMKELKRHISNDQLPIKYGGTKKIKYCC